MRLFPTPVSKNSVISPRWRALRWLALVAFAPSLGTASMAAPPASAPQQEAKQRGNPAPTQISKPREAPAPSRPTAPQPAVQKPREVAPARPTQAPPVAPRPAAQKPAESKPVAPRPVESKPVVQKPVVQKPVVQKPRGAAPARPIQAPPVAPRPAPQKPVVQQPVESKPVIQKPREVPTARKPESKPDSKPQSKPQSKPRDIRANEPVEPTRPARDDKPIMRPPSTPIIKPSPTQPTIVDAEVGRGSINASGRDSAKRPTQSGNASIVASRPEAQPEPRPMPRPEPRPERFISDTVHGVPVVRTHGKGDQFGGSGGSSRVHDYDYHIDNQTRTQYANNIALCNGWSSGARWSDCGPCNTWQRYECNDGFALSVGFGSGFSFGFFYGSSCAPLCSSWCNPWWEGYASSWNCAPYSYSYSFAYGWRPWWNRWNGCGPCPFPAWTPCYTYGPYFAPPTYTQVYTQVYTPVYIPAVYQTQPPSLPNPDALWAFLADGYDRDAEDGFVLLEAGYPADERWTIGQAIARAFRSDTVGAADLFREAFIADPSAITRTSHDPKFIARLEALERAVEPAASAAQPSIDALIVLSASQAARGDLATAYLNATTAQAEGDRSAGAAAFISWLRAELRRRP